jgi:benzoyl-CoA 2,3-dioxygenase component B
MNEILRDAYVDDNQRAVDIWNKTIAEAGLDARLRLPHRAFNRAIGLYAGVPITPDGTLVARPEWERRRDEWLPSVADRAYIAGLMKPVHEPGKMANWIAPPTKGIDNKPLEFEYVRLD